MRREKQPLFGMIDHYPIGRGQKKPGAVLVARTDPMLEYFGAPANLVKEVGVAARVLQPLGELIYARKPNPQETKDAFGRGYLHRVPIPVGDGESMFGIVYSKGSGSIKSFGDKPSPIPGYPRIPKHLLHDPIPQFLYPRVEGAMDMSEGLLEQITAAQILAHVSRKYELDDMKKALTAGVSIPLNTTLFPRLGAHVLNLLEQRFDSETDERAQETLLWEPNYLGHGTVTQIVPSDRRLYNEYGQISERKADALSYWSDPDTIRTVATTIREVFETGYVYSKGSARGHNSYNKGLVAQADNADLLSLGDVDGFSAFIPKEAYKEPMKKMQRSYLLFQQLDRQAFLTPPTSIDIDSGYTFEQMQSTQEIFWSKLMEGIVHPDAIDTVVKLMPFMRTEMIAAISFAMVDKADTAYWEKNAQERREVMSWYEEYKVQETSQEFVDHASYQQGFMDLMDVTWKDRMPINGLREFLHTGDLETLLQDDRIRGVMSMVKYFDKVSDHERFGELYVKLTEVFGKRTIADVAKKPDILTAFGNEHLFELTQHLMHADVEQAIYMADTLRLSQREGFKDRKGLRYPYEAPEYYFPALLLEQDAKEVYEQCYYAYLLKMLVYSEHFVPKAAQALDLEYSQYLAEPELRKELTEILQCYGELWNMKRQKKPKTAMTSLRRKADQLVAASGDRFAYLQIIHLTHMINIFKGVGAGVSQAYQRKAKGEKHSEEIGPERNWVLPTEEAYRIMHKTAVSTYQSQGFPLVARAYQAKLDNEKDPDLWDITEAA